MAWLLLALGVASLSLTLTALRPIRWPTTAGLFSFWWGWITGDLPLLQVVVQGAAAVLLVDRGALHTWPGQLGLGSLVLAWAGLARAHAIAHTAHEAMEDALHAAGVPLDPEPWHPRRLLLPFPMFGRAGVRMKRNLRIATIDGWKQRVDVFWPEAPGTDRPVLVFAHGGGWVMSLREFQGLPVIHRLVERGWVCFRVSYRLSPVGRFPDPLVDVKRGIAWARAHAAEWGGNPERYLALHGNSAGAHLAMLAALTPNDPRYQPGFEADDTAVDACVPVYGPTDLLNRSGDWGPEFTVFLRWLFLQRPRADRAAWEEASPIDRVAPGAPPFLVVHGELDTLVPVGESRRFVEAMRAADNAVDYAEIPGGQHALDLFHSRRGVVAADGVVRWLEHQRGLADRRVAPGSA